VFAKAHVAGDEEVPVVRAEIARARAAPTTTPGEQAALDLTEGLLLIDPVGNATGGADRDSTGVRDRATARALLDRAIAASRAMPSADANAHKARSYAYSLLVLDAGRDGDWQRVWQLLGDETGVTIDRCGLGVASEGNRSVVVVRDDAGALEGRYDTSSSSNARDVAHLVPAALRARLRACSDVDVIARPPIEGSPSLLPVELAWSYRSGLSSLDSPPVRGHRLVISNVEPPAELGLPHLMAWRSTSPPDLALEGPSATPLHALAAAAGAGYIEIHAHGMVNPAVSDASFLMLSPDSGGHYALTAAAIRKQPLYGRPIIILAACHAGATASYRHEPWSLPAAFIEAGARAVIASPDVIADADAGAFFDAVRAQIEHGASPARAMHDVRVEWIASHPDAGWVRSLIVFR
jgi:hypothetical protein